MLHERCRNPAIGELLSGIEQQHDVEILLAVEAGSRAWGLEGPGSDHDVRFVYREPPERAFSLFPAKDTLQAQSRAVVEECGASVDLSGWSLQKTLKLAKASNPRVSELAMSPVVYRADDTFHADLLGLTRQASPRVMAHYYRGQAKKNLLGRICGAPRCDVKTHLQVVRGLLSAIWIVQNPDRGGFPPLDFSALRASVALSCRPGVTPGLSTDIDRLVELKTSGGPRHVDEIFAGFNYWALGEIDALDRDIMMVPDVRPGPEEADAIFRRQYPEVFPGPAPEEISSAEI